MKEISNGRTFVKKYLEGLLVFYLDEKGYHYVVLVQYGEKECEIQHYLGLYTASLGETFIVPTESLFIIGRPVEKNKFKSNEK